MGAPPDPIESQENRGGVPARSAEHPSQPHDPQPRLVREFKRAVAGIGAAFDWFSKPDIWPWSLVVSTVVVDYFVVREFITAEPPLPTPPELPLGGVLDSNSPPLFTLPVFLVASGVLAVAYIWIAFTRHHWILKASFFVSVLVWLVVSFSAIYWVAGNRVGQDNLDYPAFGHELSKNEALYFTVGTLATAGTGNLSAKSRVARTTAILQMTVDALVLVIGIAGLVRERRGPADG